MPREQNTCPAVQATSEDPGDAGTARTPDQAAGKVHLYPQLVLDFPQPSASLSVFWEVPLLLET